MSEIVVGKSPTLRQIASDLRVSAGTVSRALANEAGVGLEKAQYIREYAAKVGYRPKPMRRKNTRTIAMLGVSVREMEPEDPFQSTMILYLSRELALAGWHTMVEIVDHETTVLPRSIWESRAEGIILMGTPSPQLLNLLSAEKIPVVVLEDTVERTGLPCVMVDVSKAMVEVVNQMLAAGHKQFGFVYSDISYASIKTRYDTIHALIKEHPGAELRAARVPNVSLQQGQVATRQLLTRNPRPTVIIYINDLLAIGGLLAINRLGLNVPDDISIIGHDNTQMGIECEPSISSVDLAMQEMARIGLRMLIQQIENGTSTREPVQEILHASVIFRNSCGPAPI